MFPRIILLLTLAGCVGYPDVPDPSNPLLTGTPQGTEPEGQCFAGPDTARIRILCEADQTPELRMELQRALAARGLFTGTADGKDGPATRDAVRRYQALFGRDDPQLTWPAAEALGLVAIDVSPAQPAMGANATSGPQPEAPESVGPSSTATGKTAKEKPEAPTAQAETGSLPASAAGTAPSAS